MTQIPSTSHAFDQIMLKNLEWSVSTSLPAWLGMAMWVVSCISPMYLVYTCAPNKSGVSTMKSYGQITRTSPELQTWQEHSPAQAWWCLVHLGSWSPNWGLLRRLHLWADLSASMDFHKLLWRCSFNNCWSMVIITKVIGLFCLL